MKRQTEPVRIQLPDSFPTLERAVQVYADHPDARRPRGKRTADRPAACQEVLSSRILTASPVRLLGAHGGPRCLDTPAVGRR